MSGMLLNNPKKLQGLLKLWRQTSMLGVNEAWKDALLSQAFRLSIKNWKMFPHRHLAE